jgi:hypothetical protein
MKRRRKTSQTPISRNCRGIEPLEPRRMLAVFTATGGNDSISISANGSTTTVIINAVPGSTSDTPITVNCGDGGDIAANLLGPVTINGAGAAGSNGVVLDNSLDTSPSTQTLNGGAFSDGQTHNISNVTSIYIQDGGGGGTLDVLRTTEGDRS